MEYHYFDYNGINYKICKTNDPSTLGCISEIVNRDEYLLSKFKNEENQTFIDIGTNCGVATIILAKQNPNSIIYAFEPDPSIFKILEKNIYANNLTNVKLYNKAVAEKNTKTISLFCHPHYSGGNTTCSSVESSKSFFGKNLKSVEVECISLDDIILNNNIDKIKLLKIDCEGAEYEILYGSEFLKNNIVENMVGEFHNLPYNNRVKSNSTDLLNYCRPYVDNILKITILTL